MLQQSIHTVLPLLPMLQQPAFCVAEDGSVTANHAAKYLAPARAESLPLWLGDTAALYESWDRENTLELPLCMMGREVTATAQSLTDGTLFLLSDRDIGLAVSGGALTVAAQVLRSPLNGLLQTTEQLMDHAEDSENPLLREHAAALTRDLFRSARICCNMADMERLRQEDYPLRLEQITLPADWKELLTELADAAADAGKTLDWQLPETMVQIYADRTLLERAVMNLLSNALKFGSGDTVRFWVDVRPSSVLFRVRNTCSDSDADLLSSAFRRLEDRGAVPDLRWGMGLGLQLVHRVAALHGGAVAMEANRGVVTVTMSFSRRLPDKNAVRSVPPMDYAGGMRHSLLELSDILPTDTFVSALY